MFRLIVVKELRDIAYSTKFLFTFGVCSLLIVLAFFLGARGYEAGRARYDAAVAEERRQLEGETDWLSVSPSVFLPPQPLAYLVPGISNDIGRTTEVSGRGGLRSEGSRFGEEPLLALFRFVDLEFAFQVVLSLLAILFAYDAVCGERERGTLRLTFAQPVPRATYILGKISGSLLALTVPLLIPLAAGGLLFLLMDVPMEGEDWLRLGLIVGAGMLYVGAILGLSVLVSALTSRSATSFVILLSLWVVGVLVAPRASVLMAARSVEVPSVDEALSQRGRLWRQLWREDQSTIQDFMGKQMSLTEGADPEERPAAMQRGIAAFNVKFDELAEERQRRLSALTDRLEEERRNRQAWQRRVALGIARLSPASAFSLAAAQLAGTSLDLPEHYLDLVDSYQERFAAFQQEKTGRSSGGIRMILKSADDEEPGPIDPSELPAFVWQPPPLGRVIRAGIFDLSLLALFNLLFFSAAFVAFLRYDVR